MQITQKVRNQLLAQGGLYTVLLLALVMLLAWVSREYAAQWDVTANARNTLAPGTQQALRELSGPVRITAFAITKSASGADVHRLLRDKLQPWQRAKSDLSLTLIDPRDYPQRANAAGLRSPNELVIEFQGRSEHLPVDNLNEQNLVNALLRLSRTASSVVYWLDGHGERRLDGIANRDLGDFGRQLQLRGYKLSSLNLTIAQAMPRNAAALIIASPQADLQEIEVGKIRAWVEAGGNLLWLIDPEPLRGLDPIAEILGLVLTPGTVVDPTLRPKTGPPILAVASNYARHPITSAFTLNTLFPGARQIGAAEREGWHVTPLLEVAQRGWVETAALEDTPQFDEAHDFRGPVNIASAFEHSLGTGERTQRVVVVGNGSFLANTFIGNGGNLQLGVAMLDWLTGDDKLIAIPPRPAADVKVNVDATLLFLLTLTFLAALPLAFAITGFVVWWRRRKAL